MTPSARIDLLSRVRRVVVKVGSAVITDHKGLNREVIARLSNQLAALHARGLDVVLVSSGAVAAGRMRMRHFSAKANLSDLPGRQAASAMGQPGLIHEYDKDLGKAGVLTAQVLLTRGGLKQRDRFLYARGTLERLLDWRVLPIINENDTVAVEELEFGDNDALAGMVVGLIGADLMINLTSADGVFDKNPHKHPDAKIIDLIEEIAGLDIPQMCDGKTAVGSGGMYSKLLAARRVAQLGSPTLILSGQGDFSLTDALDGVKCGTLILPEAHTVSSRKFWLAYHDDPAGAVTVDAGAARALIKGHKSLLPIGVTSVDGTFAKDALIRILSPEGETLGVGQCNFSSADLGRIIGKKTSDIAAVLGSCNCEEAVHRDNMLIDPAI